jgi:hypothetical protein
MYLQTLHISAVLKSGKMQHHFHKSDALELAPIPSSMTACTRVSSLAKAAQISVLRIDAIK